jgi:GT2 family glycosyltransferase/nucleoside-diphosphate-sugar epimerase
MIGCSVIIVSYNSGPIFFATLKRVLSQHHLADVIVVDNGNPPDVLARLQQLRLSEPRLKIITGQGNMGVTRASNLAAAQAAGDYLLFLHPDCLIPPNALTDMMQALRDEPQAKLAGCWLINPDGREEPDIKGPLLKPGSGLRYLLQPGRRGRRMRIIPSMPFEVSIVPTTFMCIRKEEFKKLHGFDEDFFLCCEDMDFCSRVARAGGKMLRVPRVQAVHMHTTSNSAISKTVQWERFKGLRLYYRKHFRRTPWLVTLPLLDLLLLLDYAIATRLRPLRRTLGSKALKRLDRAEKRLKLLEMGLADTRETDSLAAHRVLLTGATSQIGLFALRRLLNAGATVIAVSRDEAPPFTHARLQWIQGDLTTTNTDLAAVHADALVHCAPVTLLPGLLKLLDNSGMKRIVAFSTTAAFTRVITGNRYEKKRVEQLKAAESEFEIACTEKRIPWTVFRPTMTYGAGLDEGITWMVDVIRRYGFFPVYPPAQGRRHPVHADDAAQAVIQALDNPVTYNKAYNLSGGEVITFREILERCFRACHKKNRIAGTTALPFALDFAGWLLHKKHINAEAAYRMNDDQIFFHDPAHTDFGYAPRSFLSGGNRDIEGI